MKTHTVTTILLLGFASLVGAAPLAETVGDSLVRYDGKKLVDAPADALKDKKLIAVYYSAHWCPPCRAFTPSLVDFYEKTTAENPEFELIFVSSDRSEKDMAGYMDWGKMPFLAVDFDQIDQSPLRKHSARGIPYMVVLDADGNVVFGKPVGQDWIHPSRILPLIEEELQKNAPAS